MTYRKENAMKTTRLLIAAACVAVTCGCGSTVPGALVSARASFLRASEGSATVWSPAELQKAQLALTQAEEAFVNGSAAYRVQDLAYVAQRKAEMAEVQASIAMEQDNQTSLNDELRQDQREIMKEQATDLGQARTDLARSEEAGLAMTAQLAAEQTARRDAVTAATDQAHMLQSQSEELTRTRTALAASVAADETAHAGQVDSREDERGTIFTLTGGLLFRSDDANLMAGAETQLDQVVAALPVNSDRSMVVRAYTDSRGTEAHNLELSQRRADAVRTYLIREGVPSSQVEARGIGEAGAIGDNGTSEGRANNRRVEIVLVR